MTARVARALTVAGLAIVVAVAAARTHRTFDLTAERTLTLTAQTVATVERVDAPVRITAFLRRNEPGRVEAVAMLTRYRDLNRKVSWRVVDPDDAPGDVARLGADPLVGGVVLAAGRKVEHAASVTEQDLTSALARLQRDTPPVVCFSTGHGESELASARALLERDGYRVRNVDLLGQAAIAPDCAAVVVASPAAPMRAEASAALAAWVDADGKLLVLADPAASADADVSPLLTPWGLGLRRGVVFEGDAQSVIAADVTAPIVRTYSSAHPIVRRLPPTYFPGVQSVTVDDRAERRDPGLTVSRLADTSPASYLETQPVAAQFSPDEDAPGPVTVAAAADRSRNDGTRIARSRVVVVGDVDFATDQFLRQAGNAALFARSVEWLTAGDTEAALSSNLAAPRPLGITDARATYARLVTAGLVPALFALAGAMVWAARRDR